jgi:hypothetical protein
LAVSVNEDGVTTAHVNSVNASDKSCGLICLVADANRASVTTITKVPYNDIVIAGVEAETGVNADRNVVAAVVEKECGLTDGRVLAAGVIEKQRFITKGRVVGASCVEEECLIPTGCVKAAG